MLVAEFLYHLLAGARERKRKRKRERGYVTLIRPVRLGAVGGSLSAGRILSLSRLHIVVFTVRRKIRMRESRKLALEWLI
jgi:hypothetical protein